MQIVAADGNQLFQIRRFPPESFPGILFRKWVCHRNANHAEIFGLLPGQPGSAVGYDCDHCIGLPRFCGIFRTCAPIAPVCSERGIFSSFQSGLLELLIEGRNLLPSGFWKDALDHL